MNVGADKSEPLTAIHTGEEDRRHLCRERKALTAERVRHVNRIKGLLFSQGISGYQPLRRDRRQRLEELQTGDGRAFPQHLKALVNRELDRLELLLKQIKTVEAARDALLAVGQTAKPTPAAMLYGSPEISGYECASIAVVTYRAGEAGAQATAQSERIRPWLVANRFQAISQASMMSARLINTELASQWLRR